MQWLFDASEFMPRGECGPWATWMIWQSHASNALAFLSYQIVPVCILVFWYYKKAVLPYAWLLPWYAALISVCGVFRLFNIIVFYWPAYRLFLMLETLASVLGMIVFMATPFAVYHLTHWQQPEEIEILQRKLKRAKRVIELRRAKDHRGL